MIHSPQLTAELARAHQFVQAHPQDAQGYVRRGMSAFKLAQIEASIADFDQAARLQPALRPYLWQRGLSLYYAERFAEAAAQFELDLQVNARDLEESLWCFLCRAQHQGLEAARYWLKQMKQSSWRSDPRRVMGQVYQVYTASKPLDDLQAMTQSGKASQGFYAALYLGLLLEVQGNIPQAQTSMLKAVERAPAGDYMGYLAAVHPTLRGWPMAADAKN